MDGLFWILLWTGAIIMVGIFLYTRASLHSKWSGRKAGRAPIENASATDANVTSDGFEVSPVRVRRVEGEPEDSELEPGGSSGSDAQRLEPDRVIMLHVAATEAPFSGGDIRAAAIAEQLILGPDGFFGRSAGDGKLVFQIANMLQPGTFSIAQFGSLETPGLTAFMMLPNEMPDGGPAAWDLMLETCGRLAARLGGQLLDEERNILHEQTAQYLRDSIVEYEVRHQAHAGNEN